MTTKIHTKNATFQKFIVLKTNRNKRHKYGEFFVEGVRNINEAIDTGWQFASFIYSFDRPLSHWAQNIVQTVPTDVNYELPQHLMAELSDKEETSELLAVIKMASAAEKQNSSTSPIFVLFDRPSNKGNLGTVLRSCECFGVSEFVITGHSVDIYDADVIKSSTGAFFRVPFLQLTDNISIDAYIANLKSQHTRLVVVGTTPHTEIAASGVDLTVPVLLFLGNETDGLNRHLTEKCDCVVTIPMSARAVTESLNVSCAASILLYEISRQRGVGGIRNG